MLNILAVLLLVSPVLVLLAVMRNRKLQSELRSATVDLRLDEFCARRELADGRSEEIDWTEINEVSVLVTNRGPHRAAGGVVVLWGDETRGCLVPIDQVEESGLIERLGRLPGFDPARLLEGLQESPVKQTTVWSRDA
jgi:hypothetical protein